MHRSTDPSTAPRLTRQEVAARLACSVRSVQRLDDAELHPTRADDGSVSYDTAEVDAYVRSLRVQTTVDAGAPSPEGALASRIFAAFKSGKSQRDVVIELSVSPDVVRAYYSEWFALEEYVVGLTRAQRDTLVGITGPVSSVDGLVEGLRRTAATARERMEFTYPCETCGGPIVALADREWKEIVASRTLQRWSHQRCVGR